MGRGSFTESFPLFGFQLADYETLFSEKLDLFARLASGEPVTWSGSIRPPLKDQKVFPRWRVKSSRPGLASAARRNPWCARPITVSRSCLPSSAAPQRVSVPMWSCFHRALDQMGKPRLPVGVHSPGYIADTDAQAREEVFAPYKAMRDRIGAERGWPPMGRDEFEREATHGSFYVGSPETVATKIAATVKALGIDRFDLKYSGGPIPHAKLMRCVELYGTRVIPLVRDMLA